MGSRAAIMLAVALLVVAIAILASPWLVGSRSGSSDSELTDEVARLREELTEQSDRLAQLEAQFGNRADRPVASGSTRTRLTGGVRGPGTDAPADGEGDSSASAFAADAPDPLLTDQPPARPDPPSMMVRVDKSSVSVAGSQLGEDELAARFGTHVTSSPQAAVILRVAKGVPSRRTKRIENLAREKGITQIAVVLEGTEKKAKKKRRKRR